MSLLHYDSSLHNTDTSQELNIVNIYCIFTIEFIYRYLKMQKYAISCKLFKSKSEKNPPRGTAGYSVSIPAFVHIWVISVKTWVQMNVKCDCMMKKCA